MKTTRSATRQRDALEHSHTPHYVSRYFLNCEKYFCNTLHFLSRNIRWLWSVARRARRSRALHAPTRTLTTSWCVADPTTWISGSWNLLFDDNTMTNCYEINRFKGNLERIRLCSTSCRHLCNDLYLRMPEEVRESFNVQFELGKIATTRKERCFTVFE